MDIAGRLLSPTRSAEIKRTACAKEHVQQTVSAQTRYVTVLSPKPTAESSEPDCKTGKRALPQRPTRGNDAPLPRQRSAPQPPTQSQYVRMLLDLDEIPRRHNIYASVFTWLTLAGYIVFPGTFTSLRRSDSLQEAANRNRAGKAILDTVQNAPLLWVAGGCCFLGVVGSFALWKRWHANFIWLINRIFLPSLLNAYLGLINTLINVYTAKNGNRSVTATITVIITGTCAAVNSILFLIYNNWLLDQVKKDHEIEAMQVTQNDRQVKGA